MVVAGLVLAGMAAAVHGYIFFLESVAWTRPTTRAIFGVRSEQEAQTTKSLAFNQGFYNLFLAIEIVVGIIVLALGHTTVGATLIFVGTGSMVAAGLVLLLSSRDKASAALKQLVPPLLAIVVLALGL